MTTISIQGAHAHNLRTVDLQLRNAQLVVFRGPSGSGKSSLALDVIHAESRRRLLEVLQLAGGSDHALPRVPVASITGLPATIAVAPLDGARPAGTVAGLLGLETVLRDMYAASGELTCPETGMLLRGWTTPAIVRDLSQLDTGCRLTIGAPLPPPGDPNRLLAELRRSGFARIRLGRRLVRLDDIETLPRGVALELIIDRIKWSPDRAARLQEAVDVAWKAGSGHVRADLGPELGARTYAAAPTSPTGTVWPIPSPAHFDRAHAPGACAGCKGTGCASCANSGWGAVARNTRMWGHTLPELLTLPVQTVHSLIPPTDATELRDRLGSVIRLALGYLTLGQAQRGLGRGEWRRLTLARALHLAVSPRALIVDEPLSGLDAIAAERVCQVLRGCADAGSTVVVIEHRPEILALAHRVVTFGPGGGPAGGTITADHPPTAQTPWPDPVARSTAHPPTWTAVCALATGRLQLTRDTWTTITGPSGSGTTSLAVRTLAAHFAGRPLHPASEATGPEPYLIEPATIAGASNPRSCVITALGVWTHLRSLFAATRAARTRGLGPEDFTFNRSTGWCPACEGLGQHILQFGSLTPVTEQCGTCAGGRLRPDLEDVQWRGHSARDLLHMNILDARTLFAANPRLTPTLDALSATGLGHLPLGRPMSSLSSGERRRFSVALAVARLRTAQRDDRPTLVVLDQPDAGLDDETAARVATWLADAIEGRGTLLTVAHHPALLAASTVVRVLPARQ